METFEVNCLWSNGGAPPGRPSLSPPSHVDLAIVGGGILGLVVALRSARSGLGVQLFEAGRFGAGASGVNGGQVIPGLKHDQDALIALLGSERGRRLAAFAGGTADAVFDLMRDEGMAVPSTRAGWILAAHTETARDRIAARARALNASGTPVQVLDADAIGRLTGARGYRGGLLDPRAGTIQPFAYVSELARLAQSAGAELRPGSRVEKLEPSQGGWFVRTRSGSVLARKVLLATNADADALIPGLARTVLPLHSFQVATAPLRSEIGDAILPGGQAVSDTRRIITYFRKSPDGRLVLGGRGTLGPPRRATDWHHLEHALQRLYPQLVGHPITHRWFGRVAMTLDYLPHVHEPAPGLVAVLGCQGRGIGLMTALGGRLASYLRTGDPDELPLPITAISPIPFHRFRHLGVTAVLAWYRMLEGLKR